MCLEVTEYHNLGDFVFAEVVVVGCSFLDGLLLSSSPSFSSIRGLQRLGEFDNLISVRARVTRYDEEQAARANGWP